MAAPSRRSGLWILLMFSSFCSSFSFIDHDDDFDIASDSVLTVEHTFDSGLNPVFTKRGTIIIKSIKAESAEFSAEASLTDGDLDKLKNLVESDDIYRVRIASKTSDGSVVYVSSFIKACALYESRLSDKLTVHMHSSGTLLSVSITANTPYCSGETRSDGELSSFNTSVDVMQTVVGSAPETQAYVEKMDRDRAEKVKGQEPDNRTFFGKYWMYIVPVVILMMLANAQNPDAAGGGGGSGGGGGGGR